MLDASQQAVAEHRGSRALVLAGPGCGKTHLLAERVALERSRHGTAFDSMLCLTFTNRASRAMRERIAARLGEVPQGLYVGNLHRFCLRFLHANGLVSADTAVLDEDGMADFFGRGMMLDNAAWRAEVQAVAVEMYMDSHGFAAQLRRRLWFDVTERHRECAVAYDRYKRDSNLMDFDDCLLWTFEALREAAPDLRYARYRWVQVDEVQDLTPLQLAIVGLLAPAPDATVLYMGDEQQAIFDFLGAGAEALSQVKRHCGGRILRLNRNYRSSQHLVRLCRALAVEQTGANPDLLPDCGDDDDVRPDEPPTLWCTAAAEHRHAVAGLARRWLREHPDEDMAILVRTNAELADVHRTLAERRLPHMAVGLHDAFRSVAFRTVYAHMAVALNPQRSAEWARLLYQTGCVRRLDEAIALVGEMREAAMTPADLLSDSGMSAVEMAVEAADVGRVLPPEDVRALAALLFPARRGSSPGDLLALFGAEAGSEEAAAETLMRSLTPVLKEKLAAQRELAETRPLAALRRKFTAAYGALYAHTRLMLERSDAAPDNTLSAELDYVYCSLLVAGRINAIPRWPQVHVLLGSVVTDSAAEPCLRAQLQAHLHELCSFNEGDICDRGLGERLSVLTVHKAKGLEFDNVVLWNAGSFRGSHLDKARLFYVAFSRARRRLAVFGSGRMAAAVEQLAPHFSTVPADDIMRLAAAEMARM